MKQPSACSIRFGTFGVPLTNGDVFDLGHELSMPSPGATWIFGRSSGSVDDQADDLFLENQNLRMENVYLTLDNDDLHRENADLRREIHDLRVQTENLSRRINEPVLLPAPSAPPPPPDLLPAPWAPSSVNVRASGYPKQNSSQRVFLGTKGGEDKFEGEIDGFVYKQSNRKTEMCQAHMTGECLYGDQCHFAHKTAELRLVLRHPQYKTKVCLMDLDGGGCSYGHRCHFRHSEDP